MFYDLLASSLSGNGTYMSYNSWGPYNTPTHHKDPEDTPLAKLSHVLNKLDLCDKYGNILMYLSAVASTNTTLLSKIVSYGGSDE